MTDRELLEAAAKAAGIETHGWRAHAAKPGLYMLPITETGAYLVWNPLTDDGDALRLAVKLGMSVHCPHKHSAFVGVGETPNQFLERPGDDPYAATRRAIVRAAAAMEEKEPRCACKARSASYCPGEWEPGCDLGNDDASVSVAPEAPA